MLHDSVCPPYNSHITPKPLPLPLPCSRRPRQTSRHICSRRSTPQSTNPRCLERSAIVIVVEPHIRRDPAWPCLLGDHRPMHDALYLCSGCAASAQRREWTLTPLFTPTLSPRPLTSIILPLFYCFYYSINVNIPNFLCIYINSNCLLSEFVFSLLHYSLMILYIYVMKYLPNNSNKYDFTYPRLFSNFLNMYWILKYKIIIVMVSIFWYEAFILMTYI